MQQTKLGLRKLKESKESRQERYKCHKALKQNPLIRLDVRNRSVTLLAKELGGGGKKICIYPDRQRVFCWV